MATSYTVFLRTALLLSAAVLVSCSTDPLGSSDDLRADIYMQAVVDNQLHTLQVFPSDPSNGMITGYTSNIDTLEEPATGYLVVQGQAIYRYKISGSTVVPDTTHPMMIINFSRLYSSEPQGSELDSLVGRGAMPFVDSESPNGVEILWRDSQGTLWSSVTAPGVQQAAGRFTVESHEPKTVKNVPSHYRTTGTFNCTLYNGDGDSIVVTNGKFSLNTILYYK